METEGQNKLLHRHQAVCNKYQRVPVKTCCVMLFVYAVGAEETHREPSVSNLGISRSGGHGRCASNCIVFFFTDIYESY